MLVSRCPCVSRCSRGLDVTNATFRFDELPLRGPATLTSVRVLARDGPNGRAFVLKNFKPRHRPPTLEQSRKGLGRVLAQATNTAAGSSSATPIVQVDASPQEFVAASGGDELWYHTSLASEWPEEFRDNVDALQALLSLPLSPAHSGDGANAAPPAPPESLLWLSHAGVVSQIHYDQTENLFVQLAGRKRLLLLPPSSWPQVHPFPSLHPSYRQGQVCVCVWWWWTRWVDKWTPVPMIPAALPGTSGVGSGRRNVQRDTAV